MARADRAADVCNVSSPAPQRISIEFAQLGLSTEPDAVACAKSHLLCNGIGGVPVETRAESNRKAWLRFRYPR